MESEEKVAPKRDPLEVVKGFSGILPGKVVYATPPAFKEAFPNQPDKWPVYKVKPSDGLDFNNNMDKDDWFRIEGGRVLPLTGKIRVDKLKKHVLDWRKHRAGDAEIPCTKGLDGLLDDVAISSLSPELQGWLLGVIADSESVSKEESEGLKF